MLKARIVAGLLVLAIPAIVSAQAPSCEEQLALANQLLLDGQQDRWRLQVEVSSLKLKQGLAEDLKKMKDAAPQKETTKK
jgi:hypothetical protein